MRSEALSLINELLNNRSSLFSRGYLNSEGRKLVARLLRLLAKEQPWLFKRLKRLYPSAPEDRWVKAAEEVKEELLATVRKA